MRILLTNDDGVHSEGINALRNFFEKEHEVWVFAPEQDRSAISHSMTLKKAVRIKDLGNRRFSCSGTPVDCILLSHLGVLGMKPDFVISGINHGSNLGSDILFSGTAAAARQATLMGYPACAISLDSTTPPFYFHNALEFLKKNFETLSKKQDMSFFFNINVPNQEKLCSEVELASLSRLVYTSTVSRFDAPDGEAYCFFKASIEKTPPPPGTDWDIVSRGRIAVSPVVVLPVLSPGFRDMPKTMFQPPA